MPCVADAEGLGGLALGGGAARAAGRSSDAAPAEAHARARRKRLGAGCSWWALVPSAARTIRTSSYGRYCAWYMIPPCFLVALPQWWARPFAVPCGGSAKQASALAAASQGRTGQAPLGGGGAFDGYSDEAADGLLDIGGAAAAAGHGGG